MDGSDGDEYETDSEEGQEESGHINEIRDAAMFGITRSGVEATKHLLSGDNDEGNDPEQQAVHRPPPVQFSKPENFKVSARVVEQGRKVMHDKLNEQEMNKKVKLYNEILAYYEHFPHIKEKAVRKKINVETTSLAILLEERLRIERELNTGNVLETVKKLDVMTHYMMEPLLINFFNIPAQGLHQEAARSQAIMEQELKEFSVKYAHWFSSGPEWRYAMKFLQRTYLVIRRNQTMQNPNMPTEDISEKAQNKYKDL
jgi:hypothetical protein